MQVSSERFRAWCIGFEAPRELITSLVASATWRVPRAFIAPLVAQMTTTFEKVKEMSNAYRLFQKVHLIEEFKQYHDTP